MNKSIYASSRLGGPDNTILARIKKMSSNISWTMIAIIIFVIALITISYFIYKDKLKPLFSPSFLKNKEGGFLDSSSKDTSKNVELFFFYATWCPHCKTAKPIWEQVKKEYEGKNVNGYNLIFTDIDCTTESPDVEKMMNTYKIEGFPTIKMLKEGQVIEFDAKPTKSNIEKFINTVL
jgi:thiol-disulfide isomerase/thioredoxin